MSGSSSDTEPSPSNNPAGAQQPTTTQMPMAPPFPRPNFTFDAQGFPAPSPEIREWMLLLMRTAIENDAVKNRDKKGKVPNRLSNPALTQFGDWIHIPLTRSEIVNITHDCGLLNGSNYYRDAHDLIPTNWYQLVRDTRGEKHKTGTLYSAYPITGESIRERNALLRAAFPPEVSIEQINAGVMIPSYPKALLALSRDNLRTFTHGQMLESFPVSQKLKKRKIYDTTRSRLSDEQIKPPFGTRFIREENRVRMDGINPHLFFNTDKQIRLAPDLQAKIVERGFALPDPHIQEQLTAEDIEAGFWQTDPSQPRIPFAKAGYPSWQPNTRPASMSSPASNHSAASRPDLFALGQRSPIYQISPDGSDHDQPAPRTKARSTTRTSTRVSTADPLAARATRNSNLNYVPSPNDTSSGEDTQRIAKRVKFAADRHLPTATQPLRNDPPSQLAASTQASNGQRPSLKITIRLNPSGNNPAMARYPAIAPHVSVKASEVNPQNPVIPATATTLGLAAAMGGQPGTQRAQRPAPPLQSIPPAIIQPTQQPVPPPANPAQGNAQPGSPNQNPANAYTPHYMPGAMNAEQLVDFLLNGSPNADAPVFDQNQMAGAHIPASGQQPATTVKPFNYLTGIEPISPAAPSPTSQFFLDLFGPEMPSTATLQRTLDEFARSNQPALRNPVQPQTQQHAGGNAFPPANQYQTTNMVYPQPQPNLPQNPQQIQYSYDPNQQHAGGNAFPLPNQYPQQTTNMVYYHQTQQAWVQNQPQQFPAAQYAPPGQFPPPQNTVPWVQNSVYQITGNGFLPANLNHPMASQQVQMNSQWPQGQIHPQPENNQYPAQWAPYLNYPPPGGNAFAPANPYQQNPHQQVAPYQNYQPPGHNGLVPANPNQPASQLAPNRQAYPGPQRDAARYPNQKGLGGNSVNRNLTPDRGYWATQSPTQGPPAHRLLTMRVR